MELATYACQSVLESPSHDIIFFSNKFGWFDLISSASPVPFITIISLFLYWKEKVKDNQFLFGAFMDSWKLS